VNQYTLTAGIVERQPVRYTPAGVPVAALTLAYAGDEMEAGSLRQLRFEMSALAIGDTALAVQRVEMGSSVVWKGFLAPKKQGSKHFDFHVTAFECERMAG
jgi:primosomal replication protein N